MIKRIEGTESTRKMIGNIVEDLQKRRPQKNHVDYFMTLREKRTRSEFLTDDNKGTLRNVSLFYLNNYRIHGAVGNKTGNILITQKPFFMSAKKAVEKIQDFLAKLQPEKRAEAKRVSAKSDKPDFDFEESELDATFDKFSIHQKVQGSNNCKSWEVFDEYIKL